MRMGSGTLTIDNFLKTIPLLTESKRLWIGYSGGLDSHVLLDLAVQAFRTLNNGENDEINPYFIGAIHVHHGLSPNADGWAEHCEQICSELQVPLKILWVDATPMSGESQEEAARIVRYKAWEEFLQPEDCLMLAHHEGDQAETILLRLFRGAGPLGLGGMNQKSKLGEQDLIRPLLLNSKEQIESYAKERKLNWIEDESNLDTRFDRNFLRHEIFPKLNARWPRVVRSVSRSAALCLETATAVQVLASQDLETVHSVTEKALSVKSLLKLEPIRRRGVLRCWFKNLGFLSPSRDHLERIDREVLQAKPGSKPRLKIDDYEIRRLKDDLCVKKCEEWELIDMV